MTEAEWWKLVAWCRAHIDPQSRLYGPAYLTLIRRCFNSPALTIQQLTTEQGREFARWVKANA